MASERFRKMRIVWTILLTGLINLSVGLSADAQSPLFSRDLSLQEQEELRAIGLELNKDPTLGITDTLSLPDLSDDERVLPGSLAPITLEGDHEGSFPLNVYPFQVVPGERTEDEIRALDDPVLRERILRSFSVDSACNSASDKWYQTLRDLGGSSGRDSFVEILRKADRTNPAKAIRDASDYDQACLRGRQLVDSDLQSAGIREVSAVLSTDNQPRCSALRVAQNLFLTARHCLYDKNTGQRNVDIGDLSISLATDGFQTSYKVLSVQADRSGTAPIEQAYTTSDDFIYLLSSGVLVNMPTLVFQSPSSGTQVTLGGYFRFHRLREFLANITDPVLDTQWSEGFRHSNPAQCVIGEVSPECAIHYCQSDARFSGTGVFSRALSSDNALVVSGLHIASAGRGLGCGFSHTGKTGNVLIAIK